MTSEEIEELKQLIALQRELTRQRLRTATCEAWVDDVQQKMAINRAVYAAGYGIAPKQPDEGKADASATVSVQTPPAPPTPPQVQPAAASLAARLAPWAIVAASVLGAGGLGSAAWYAAQPTPVAPAVEFPEYNVEKWTPPERQQ